MATDIEITWRAKLAEAEARLEVVREQLERELENGIDDADNMRLVAILAEQRAVVADLQAKASRMEADLLRERVRRTSVNN